MRRASVLRLSRILLSDPLSPMALPTSGKKGLSTVVRPCEKKVAHVMKVELISPRHLSYRPMGDGN